MSKAIQIAEAIRNAEANVDYLASLPDAALAEKLDTVHLQMQLAEEKRNTAAIDLLEVWRSQIIAARIYKAENNIPDAVNVIKQAIKDIETVAAVAEERNEEINENAVGAKRVRSKVPVREDDDSQLSMF